MRASPPDHASLEHKIEELTKKLARVRGELGEARDQQAATGHILSVISSLPMDLPHVFAKVATSAARLCDAYDAAIAQVDGDVLRIVAHDGPIPVVGPVPIVRGVLMGRAVIEREIIHVADLQAEAAEYPEGSEYAQRLGHRTMLAVPLNRAGEAIGVIALRRMEKRPFSDSQIALLKTFADQAVLAIESARLLEEAQARTKEVQESLEYQMATSDVLNVISSSPNELQPVLDAILDTARRLCHSDVAQFFLLDNGRYRLAAHKGSSLESVFLENPISPETVTPSITGKAARERRTIHVPDVAADTELAGWLLERKAKGKSILAVPLIRGEVAIGVITLVQTSVRPFTERQIELVSTFASQAVIAINNVDLFEEVQARTAELTDTLERQTATSEVLSVISRSPTQLQPVLDAIAATAARLCRTDFTYIVRLEGDCLRLVATNNADAEHARFVARNPQRLDRGSLAGRVALEHRTIHVPDVLEDPEYTRWDSQRLGGQRSMLGVPLLRESETIGVILLLRTAVQPFTEKEIDIVTTFADQAVIAIENTRLFEEVQKKNSALTEAHAQVSGAFQRETATSEILRVIGSSPTDVQPVFETIARSGVNVCDALGCVVLVVDGSMIRVAATHGVRPERLERFHHVYPIPLSAEIDTARTIRQRRLFHLADIEHNPSASADDIENARLAGYRTRLMVPMVRGEHTLGLIAVTREEPTPFPEQLVELLKTFADQAVIAIENARLFEQVQARTRELQESLEYQTAISDVLSVISKSPHALQPVLDAIMTTAARLCQATHAHVRLLREDGAFHIAANRISDPELLELLQTNPFRPGLDSVAGRAALRGVPVHVPNVAADPLISGIQRSISGKVQTALSVPLKRNGIVVGLISLWHDRVQPFTQRQIDLVATFADQAVIAINNVGLFEEVQARNRDLTALGEVGRAVSSTLDLKTVLKTIVDRAVELSGTDAGSIFYHRQETGRFELGETSGLDEEVVAKFRKLDIATGQSGLGEAIVDRLPLQVPDVIRRASNPLRDAALEVGLRAALIVPLFGSEGALGALLLQRRRTGDFLPAVVNLMQSFADQSAIALENARLFEEIARKSRELEIASQHKSQFVANMSHELRTPLAAILGYAELMQEGFYEPQGAKSLDALSRIRSNGKHLLGLINTVLDIAKIESGQFSLNLGEYALENVVETVRAATEALAETKKLGLKTEVTGRLPVGMGDEQRLTQVLLNLVGNAIKFTDRGEVRISASAENSHFAVRVTDTGPGIASEEQGRIFEQFHQVDSSSTKAKGGTGLGLAIAKQIVEMHGGRIWVESTLGKGATFRMELPIRAANRAAGA